MRFHDVFCVYSVYQVLFGTWLCRSTLTCSCFTFATSSKGIIRLFSFRLSQSATSSRRNHKTIGGSPLSVGTIAQGEQPNVPLSKQIGVAAIIFFGLVGFVIGMYQAWDRLLTPFYLCLFIFFYNFAGLGVTAGLHRYLTHASFEATRFFESVLMVQAGFAVEGFAILWAANHRKHHQYSDGDEDMHSPMKSWLHAHCGWFFSVPDADPQVYAPDLLARPTIVFWNKMFPLLVFISFAYPTLIGAHWAAWWGEDVAWGAFQGLLWGGLVRMVAVHHVTWSVNSACHLWGWQTYQTPGVDQSRNNPVVGLLALGEGWHNNHHAFPKSVQHAPWWIDSSLWYIIFWFLLGQAKKLKFYRPQLWERKKRRRAALAA